MLIIAAGTPWWVTWGAAFIAASAAISVPFVQHYLKTRHEPAVDNADNVLLYSMMWDAAFEVDARRALILKAHGRPQKGKPILISIIKECAFLPLLPQGPNWIRTPVEGEYVEMLLELMAQGYLHLKTEDLPDGVLKDIYSTQGIIESELFLLYANGNVIYMSFNYQREARIDRPLHRELMRGNILRIKKKLHKMGVLKKDETAL